jgi:ribosomal protein S18 acetylase RimI-like enzyme
MQIRVYEAADERQVVALWNAVLPGAAPHHDPATSIRKKLEYDRDLFFVAQSGDEIVGTAMGGYDGHRGWIYSVAVAPEHRRRGVGTALLRRIEEALVELGCPKVNLQVLPGHAGAVCFYERLGYRMEERISLGKCLY